MSAIPLYILKTSLDQSFKNIKIIMESLDPDSRNELMNGLNMALALGERSKKDYTEWDQRMRGSLSTGENATVFKFALDDIQNISRILQNNIYRDRYMDATSHSGELEKYLEVLEATTGARTTDTKGIDEIVKRNEFEEIAEVIKRSTLSDQNLKEEEKELALAALNKLSDRARQILEKPKSLTGEVPESDTQQLMEGVRGGSDAAKLLQDIKAIQEERNKLLTDNEELRQQLFEYESESARQSATLDLGKGVVTASEITIQDLTDTVAERERQNRELRENLENLTTEKDKLDSEARKLREGDRNKQTTIRNLGEEIERLKTTLESSKNENERLKSVIAAREAAEKERARNIQQKTQALVQMAKGTKGPETPKDKPEQPGQPPKP